MSASVQPYPRTIVLNFCFRADGAEFGSVRHQSSEIYLLYITKDARHILADE